MKEILERLDSIDSRLNQIETRFDRVDARFDLVDARFNQVDARFDRMDARFDQADARSDRMDARFDQVHARSDGIEMQLHKQGVLLESVSADFKQTLEAVIGNRQVMDQEFASLRRQIDERVQPIEWAGRHFSKELAARGGTKRARRKTRA